MDIFPNWNELTEGDTISFLARTIVLNNQGRHLVCPIDCPSRRVVVVGELPQVSDTFTFLGVKVVASQSFVCCRLPDASHALPISPCLGDDLKMVVELCSGMGAFSSVSKLLGCHLLAGVDQNPIWEGLFKAMHQEDAVFLAGDIGDLEIVKRLHWLGATHAITLAGISCQPYSAAGDKLGFKDTRSQSLPKALLTAWLLQSPICVLECVDGIKQYPEVTKLLDAFCKTTGFCITEKVLHLDHVWCTKRTRWFAILTSPVLGPIQVMDFPQCDQFRCVGEVLKEIPKWPQSDVDQLGLSLYELTKFGDYAKGGIESCYLSLAGIMPTVLHSAGGQLYPCRCGCRQALSISRLENKGLFCTLVPLDSYVFHENVNRRHCRYLHPAEAFFLNGGSPNFDWGKDLRLGLSAVGQCVSPLQAIWILGHVVQKVHGFLGLPPFNPTQAFQMHIDQILQDSCAIWPAQIPNEVSESAQLGISANQCLRDFVVSDACTGTTIAFRAEDNIRVADFIAAQKALNPTEDVQMPDVNCDESLPCRCSIGSSLGNEKAKDEQTKLQCPCQEWESEDIAPTQAESILPADEVNQIPVLPPSKSDDSPLCALDSKGLLELSAPLLMIVNGLQGLKKQTLTQEQRIKILEIQGDLWADDEILFHLSYLANVAPEEQKLIVWDPLIMSSMVRSGCMRPMAEYAKQLECGNTVITAVLIEQHWYPMVWRWDHDGLHSFTCGLTFNFSMALQTLTKELCRCLKLEPRPVKNRPVKFPVTCQCGALAISFVRQLISGTAFVNSAQELSMEHHVLRQAFVEQIAGIVPRPWIWGQGEEWSQKLKALLQEHGVPLEDVQGRAQMVIDKLGASVISKAMQGPQPWRELKNLANQVVPMVQLIRHSELQEVIQKRAAAGHAIGTKAQKAKSKGKGKGAGQASLDPALLRVETGVFVCGNQSPLCQIELAKV